MMNSIRVLCFGFNDVLRPWKATSSRHQHAVCSLPGKSSRGLVAELRRELLCSFQELILIELILRNVSDVKFVVSVRMIS